VLFRSRIWIWRGVYWVIFLWCWCLVPFLQGYVYAGDFSFLAKCRCSVRANIFYYSSMAIVGLVVTIYVAVSLRLGIRSILDLGFAVSNAYMTVVLVCFLGYGLISVPRTILTNSDASTKLSRGYRKVASRRKILERAKAQLRQDYKDLEKFDKHIPATHHFKKYICDMQLSFSQDIIRELGIRTNTNLGNINNNGHNTSINSIGPQPSLVETKPVKFLSEKNDSKDSIAGNNNNHSSKDDSHEGEGEGEKQVASYVFQSSTSASASSITVQQPSNRDSVRFLADVESSSNIDISAPASNPHVGILGLVGGVVARMLGLGNRKVEFADTVTYTQIVQLHTQMKTATMLIRKRRCEFNQIVSETIALENMLQTANATKNVRTAPGGSSRNLGKSQESQFSSFAVFRAKVWLALRSVLMKLAFIVTGCLSCLVLWSEVAMSVSFVNISIFGLINHIHIHSLIVGTAVVILAYITYCTYRTLFSVRILDYVHLVSNGQSDPYSLLFISGYSCRLVIPTCYNVLTMARLSGTVFSKLLGTGQTAAALGERLSHMWAPLIIVVVASITCIDCVLCPKANVSMDDEEKEGRAIANQAREAVKGKGGIKPLSRLVSKMHVHPL